MKSLVALLVIIVLILAGYAAWLQNAAAPPAPVIVVAPPPSAADLDARARGPSDPQDIRNAFDFDPAELAKLAGTSIEPEAQVRSTGTRRTPKAMFHEPPCTPVNDICSAQSNYKKTINELLYRDVMGLDLSITPLGDDPIISCGRQGYTYSDTM